MAESEPNGSFFNAIDEWELGLCLFFNSGCHRTWIRQFFSAVSWLGNGIFWYVLAASLPVVYGFQAIPVFLHMLGVGVFNVLLYTLLKKRLGRHRPFVNHREIHIGTAPLDWYSFPSGHTLHAVSFTIVVMAYFPVLGLVLIPFSVLIALSRLVLGLHYPSDVLAGSCIGAMVAFCSFLFL
ncbi:MAG: phosphatase PAP2 family protein [Desulfovibrionales bacterium]